MSEIDQLSNAYLEEHTVHIGRVVLSAAFLDDAICTFIAEFLGLEEYQENALLRPMMSRAKVDLLRRLTNHYLPQTAAKQMASIFNDVQHALEERNALIHGVPAQVEGKIAFVSYSGKNRLLGEPELWPVQRVCALANRFIALSDTFSEMVERFQTLKESGENPEPPVGGAPP